MSKISKFTLTASIVLALVFTTHGGESSSSLDEPSSGDPKEMEKQLASEAKKWQKDMKDYNCPNKTIDGQYFSFSSKASQYETECNWTATSKVKVGGCPAKSVWKMEFEGLGGSLQEWSNQIPSECKAITPKIISNYKGSFHVPRPSEFLD